MAVSKKNFFKDHYDWLVALAGLVLLVGVVFLFITSDNLTEDAARSACDVPQENPRLKAKSYSFILPPRFP